MSSAGDIIITSIVDPVAGITSESYITPPASGAFVLGKNAAGGWACIQDATPSASGLMSSADKGLMAGAAKRRETYSGTSAATTGAYTVTFATAFPAAPNIQANIINPSDTQSLKITAISTTGFTVVARNRTDALGLLPAFANASGLPIDVLITEK